jgi:hypothetical protein
VDHEEDQGEGRELRARLATRVLGEAEYPAWNDLVARSAQGAVYSSPEYLDALCEAAGGSFRILAVEKGGELLGGIALYERTSRLGPYVSPRLLLYYNGVVLRPYETRYPSQHTSRQNEILEALVLGLAALGYGRVTLRNRSSLSDVRVFLARGWTARLQYSYVVPLADMDRLWGRMEQNLRRLVERSAREGLSVTEDDDFDSFFRLHSQIHERKGTSLYLLRAPFERFFMRLRSRDVARLYHARLPQGQSVSTQLVLRGPHPVSDTVCAASDGRYLNLGATAFLRWNVFKRLSEEGFASNDLTDAALNPVTHFKAQLGGDLHMCLLLESPESARFRWTRRGREASRHLRRKVRALAGRLRRRPPQG